MIGGAEPGLGCDLLPVRLSLAPLQVAVDVVDEIACDRQVPVELHLGWEGGMYSIKGKIVAR